MATKPLVKMTTKERAKQFMPFKAVSGLDEALERKRIEMGVKEKEPDDPDFCQLAPEDKFEILRR